jgi:hypothetical protein
MQARTNVGLAVLFLFNVGCASQPTPGVSASDHTPRATNRLMHRSPTEIAPMTEQERNYYKDNAKGKFLFDSPK